MTGALPFDGESVGDLLVKICTAPPPVPSRTLPGLPPAFDVWFARTMEREPERRFASATELADALALAAGLSGRRGGPVSPHPGYAGSPPPYSGTPYPSTPLPIAPYSGTPYPSTPLPGRPYPGTLLPGTPYPGAPSPHTPLPTAGLTSAPFVTSGVHPHGIARSSLRRGRGGAAGRVHRCRRRW